MKQKKEKKQADENDAEYSVTMNLKVHVEAYKHRKGSGIRVKEALISYRGAILHPPFKLMDGDETHFAKFMENALDLYVDYWLLNRLGVKDLPLDLTKHPELLKDAEEWDGK